MKPAAGRRSGHIAVARAPGTFSSCGAQTWRRITWPKSEHFPRFRSDPGRTHLRAAEAPSAQIGRRSALEMDTPERTTQTASPNVVALKNGMGHQVDADGKLRQGTRLIMVNFFPAATTPLPRHIGETGL